MFVRCLILTKLCSILTVHLFQIMINDFIDINLVKKILGDLKCVIYERLSNLDMVNISNYNVFIINMNSEIYF